MCTGTVISPHLVLTASHCATALSVLIGESAMTPDQVISVVNRDTHPRADAAILLAGEPLLREPMLLTGRDSTAPYDELTAAGLWRAR
jgi:hypothetical protein